MVCQAQSGYEVVVYEAREKLGGNARTYTAKAFRNKYICGVRSLSTTFHASSLLRIDERVLGRHLSAFLLDVLVLRLIVVFMQAVGDLAIIFRCQL